MQPMKVIPAILIMFLPEAIEVAVAAEPAVTAAASDRPIWVIVESLLLVLLGTVFVSLAALGRRTLRKSSNRVHHVPAFPQQRN